MTDKRRDYLMIQGFALIAARFLAYFRSRGSGRGFGLSENAHQGVMLNLAIAVHNLEEAATRLLDIPRRRIKK